MAEVEEETATERGSNGRGDRVDNGSFGRDWKNESNSFGKVMGRDGGYSKGQLMVTPHHVRTSARHTYT